MGKYSNRHIIEDNMQNVNANVKRYSDLTVKCKLKYMHFVEEGKLKIGPTYTLE